MIRDTRPDSNASGAEAVTPVLFGERLVQTGTRGIGEKVQTQFVDVRVDLIRKRWAAKFHLQRNAAVTKDFRLQIAAHRIFTAGIELFVWHQRIGCRLTQDPGPELHTKR